MYPKKLIPTKTELFYINNQEMLIPKCVITFDSWEGEPIKETFGGKPIVSVNNKPMFAELAIMELFILSGWEARWAETYARGNKPPIFLTNWIDDKYKNQKENPIQDKEILNILESIKKQNNNSYAGCWDVIGWKDNKIIFAEAKRSKKDKIRTSQINWLESGLKIGLKKENFMIVEWCFNK